MGRCFENVTITIKDILQSYSFPNVIPHQKPWESMSADQIITAGKDQFFDFTFPWYSEDNAGLDEFKELFLHKYYMRQIGQETTGQFKLYLKSRLLEKMPYYKELYNTTLIDYDPLVNRKWSKMLDELSNGSELISQEASGISESQSTISTETNNQAFHSENPEVTIANNDYASNMDRERKKADDIGNTTSESQGQGNEERNKNENRNVVESMEGFEGNNQTDVIMRYREAILNINEMICNDMADLFLGYYGGEDYALTF